MLWIPTTLAGAETASHPFAASRHCPHVDDVRQTTATLEVFILAMALYPEVQEKAQRELDEVIGRSRLPDFSDRHSLPYIGALCKELVRWHVVGTMAIPHATTREDEFRGYRIPKGSIVVPNNWYAPWDALVSDC